MENNLSRQAIFAEISHPLSFEDVMARGYATVDLRAAGEYLSGTIPGAINIPLFDDDERGVIGTLYRHVGQARAVDAGFEYTERKLSHLISCFELFRGKEFVVFCARGGMRSLAVVNLLSQVGFKVYQLEGGYKKYRHYVLTRLNGFQPRLIVIHGLTGTGKTRIIERLDHALDLEGLACHRSSLFGGLDRKPENQKNFEGKLVDILGSLAEEPYFIEGESRKIGKVFIPERLAMAMKNGVLVCVHCSMETRIRRILEDYPVMNRKMRREIELILKSLKQKMGAVLVARMCELLQRGELEELVHILLVQYYDKRYGKSMGNYKYHMEFSSENIDDAVEKCRILRRNLLHNC